MFAACYLHQLHLHYHAHSWFNSQGLTGIISAQVAANTLPFLKQSWDSVPVFTGQLEIYISNITSTWILFLFSLSRPSFSASASTLTSTAYPPFSKFWWNATVDLNHLFLVTGISQRTSAQTWKFYLVAIRVIRHHYSYTFRHLLVHRSHDSPET